MEDRTLTRREALGWGCRLGVAACLGVTGGCSGPLRTTPNEKYLKTPLSADEGRVVLGWYETTDLRQVCEQAVPQVTDMKWLGRGDSVFIKVACNSHYPHPAVTAPDAVRAMVGFFKDRGAGIIYVGDQAGVEHVRLTRYGRQGSTREVMEHNGLLYAIEGSGAKLYNFDDHGYGGYFRAEPDFKNHWQGTLWIPKIIRHVDHIVYLPRLGTHGTAGYTCGIKNAVGWVRDDSRLVLHQRCGSFFEKMAEINHVESIRTRLRLTVTMGHSALLNIGPDFGGRYDFDGACAVASTRLVDHDYLASVLLPWLDDHDVSFFDVYSPYPNDVNFWNRKLVRDTWGSAALRAYEDIMPYRLSRSLEHDICISHLAWLQGYRPRRIRVVRQGGRFPAKLKTYLSGVGGQMLKV